MTNGTITWQQLSRSQQSLLEEAYDAEAFSSPLGAMPIRSHLYEQPFSDTAKLCEMGLLDRTLVMAGFQHNEYGYVITEAGKALVAQTDKAQKRAERKEWLGQYEAGKISEEQFLDLLDSQRRKG